MALLQNESSLTSMKTELSELFMPVKFTPHTSGKSILKSEHRPGSTSARLTAEWKEEKNQTRKCLASDYLGSSLTKCMCNKSVIVCY